MALFGQANLGPADDFVGTVGDLLSAFDNNRLTGAAAPLPGAYAMIPAATVNTFPHYGDQGCSTLRDYDNRCFSRYPEPDSGGLQSKAHDSPRYPDFGHLGSLILKYGGVRDRVSEVDPSISQIQ